MSSILNWLPCSPLGSGSFGHVSLALNLLDGSLFAAKSAPSSSSPSILALHNELLILQSLHSPFIIRCLGADFLPSSQPVLFLEYMDGGSLADLVMRRSGGKLCNEKLVAHYTHAILQGLEYLHENEIVHGDIKSHNILIGSSGIKIADFGAARRMGEASELDGTLRGTPLWMAPEVMQGVEQGKPSDIWSLGCTVVEMLQGRAPWAHISNLGALFLKVGSSQEKPPLPECISAEAKDFLLQCLQRDPKARPTAAELLKHPFLCSCLQADVKDHMYDQPSPRSTFNFVQSDCESDWEDESMMDSVPISGFSPATATARTAAVSAEQAALKINFDGASNWMTVRCSEKGCEKRQAPFMEAAETVHARKGCEVSLDCAAFLRKRKTSVG